MDQYCYMGRITTQVSYFSKKYDMSYFPGLFRLQGAPQYFHQSGNMYPQGNWVNQQNVHNRMNFQFNGGQGLWQPQNLHFQRPRNIQFVNRTGK